MKHDFILKIAASACTAMLASVAGSISSGAQELNTEVFSLLNLDYPGLEQVKELHTAGKDSAAAVSLLDYYRNRTGISTPEINLKKIRISEKEQQWADDALEHTFFVHYGYQPSFNYGEDIDWRYWPVKDNELRWQLHRHKWFIPMGKAYRVSGDEKYAEEWVRQYMDWIYKNPNVKISKEEYEITDNALKADAENARFAWRPLEVSDRLQNQITQFELFKVSPAFTPEFLTEFLVNYYRHAEHILANYSDSGNHLLFEAQRMIYAGAFFPEFKDAAEWRKSGIDILNREIKVQVYDDGGQYELDPHYHLASINIFCKALYMADMNGFRSDFPQSYLDTVEKMIMFYANICFPDYTNPCFSDAKITDKKEMLKNYRQWEKIFPDNQTIKYLATEGKEGQLPDYLSKGFLTSGFFVFRNSWGPEAVQMVVKAGPKGYWHCQPDNGTFTLYRNGRRFSPDAGCYTYNNGSDRETYRRANMHNTMTKPNGAIDNTLGKFLYQGSGRNYEVVVTENPSYDDLTFRRAVFLVDNSFYVLVDEGYGTYEGAVNLHFKGGNNDTKDAGSDMFVLDNVPSSSNSSEAVSEGTAVGMHTVYTDTNNMLFTTVPETHDGYKAWWNTQKFSDKIDTALRRRVYRIELDKAADKAARFITVIYPYGAASEFNSIEISARLQSTVQPTLFHIH